MFRYFRAVFSDIPALTAAVANVIPVPKSFRSFLTCRSVIIAISPLEGELRGFLTQFQPVILIVVGFC
jgi:hypothetical protein